MVSPRSATDDPPTAAPGSATDQPRHGDLVVICEARSVVRYSIRQVPGEPQVTIASKDEALRLARAFARHCRVDVWYDADGDLRRLDGYRVPDRR